MMEARRVRSKSHIPSATFRMNCSVEEQLLAITAILAHQLGGECCTSAE